MYLNENRALINSFLTLIMPACVNDCKDIALKVLAIVIIGTVIVVADRTGSAIEAPKLRVYTIERRTFNTLFVYQKKI